MKATSTRSRFCRRCLRPAWAPSSRCCVTGTDLSVIALIGIILLIGIVKKNAIMMIDFALEAQREQGMSPAQAIYQACLLRFRPIMMTTMAALLGARSAGARHRRRIRTAAPARHHHHRRTHRQPGADALHDAGGLSVLRSAGGAIQDRVGAFNVIDEELAGEEA